MKNSFALMILLLIGCLPSVATDNVRIYLSPSGMDSNYGSFKKPVRTLEQAMLLAAPYYGKKTVEFILLDGTYYLEHPLRITDVYSGTAENPVVFKAQNTGKAVISGGRKLELKWEPFKDSIYCVKVPDGITSIDQLYVNGRRRQMARYPNTVAGKNIFDTWNLGEKNLSEAQRQDPLYPERVARWKNPEGAFLHAMHNALWGDMHWMVTGKNADGTLVLEGGWQNNRPSRMHETYRMIENIFEELDAPDEWYFDATSSMLYFYPCGSDNLTEVSVEVVDLDNLITFSGKSKERPVAYIEMRGLVFCQTARTFMQNKEPLLRSDWTTFRGGAVSFTNAVDCRMKDCDFNQVGGNTVFVSNYNKNLSFVGCYIFESGANGFAFVGNPAMVKSPLFTYSRQNYEAIDRTPGALGNDYPQNCLVEDCLITRTGRYEKQTAPVQISMSYGITVNHCSIYDVPRAGINISEGTFGGHVIENCDIFNTVLETGDHGSFNSWGRDRYWTPDCKETESQVRQDTLLPHLDVLAPNIIRNSRWRCDHGWDIDLDDGSSYYHIYNNLLLNRGLKLREGYGRVVTNNIIVNNSLHPHVWYGKSGDVVKGNIFFRGYMPALMNACIADSGKWGNEVDYNFFISAADRDKFRKNSCDLHSLVGNPQFVDAEHGDYRLSPQSPVRQLGFKDIPMDSFGVVSPRLRRIAKTPELPVLILNQQEDAAGECWVWQGMTLKNMETLGEQSATGTKDLCGVLILSIEYDSPWVSSLRANDVIQQCNGGKVCDLNDLKKCVEGRREVELAAWRNQQVVRIAIINHNK